MSRDTYINGEDMIVHIDDLWKRTSRKLKKKGIKPSDVDKAIQDVRVKNQELKDPNQALT